MHKIFLTALFSGCTLLASGQTNRFTHIVDESENKIEFRSDDNQLKKVIDVESVNPYLKLSYSFTKRSGENQYKTKPGDRTAILKLFTIDASKPESKEFSTGILSTNSNVSISENHVVVTSHLLLLDYGIVAIKSITSVYNADGSINSVLPENNDGYFEPVVTDNGKFLATNYGDLCGECAYSVAPFPGFRIYDLATKNIIYDIQPHRADLQSPTTVGNLIVQVLTLSADHFAYLVIDPTQHQIYSRTFTKEEVGQFVRFGETGFFVKNNGIESQLNYEASFYKSWF